MICVLLQNRVKGRGIRVVNMTLFDEQGLVGRTAVDRNENGGLGDLVIIPY